MSYTEHIQDAERITARCAIVTLSDTRTESTDKSGRRIRELIESAQHSVAHYQILRDDPDALEVALSDLTARSDVDVVITNGGTGISRRDGTAEVVEQTLDKPIPGFGELFRMLSWQQIGSGAMLSRALGGVVRDKLLFALPGSTAAVELAMTQLILPQLKHLLWELRK